jgi:hypothetical protein
MKCRARSRLPLAWAVVAMGLLLPAPVRGQSLGDGQDALDKQFREYNNLKKLIPRLFRRQNVEPLDFNPTDPDHAKAVEVAAKYVTYRFTWSQNEARPGEIHKVFLSFESDLSQLTRLKLATEPLGQAYARQVMLRAQEVIKDNDSKPIARLNAARVLVRLAEFGQGELADALVEVLKDATQNEGVHYYALRGLHDLLALPPRMPPVPPVLDKARQEKCVLALLEVVGRNESFLPSVPPERVDGFRALRREAVRALALITAPALSDKARPAQALLRVVANDERVIPKPRLDERLEASIGIARMRPGMAKDYQPGYAVYHVGYFVQDFAAAANPENDSKSDKKESYARSRPWKVDAARLSEALEGMKKDLKDPYVAEVVQRCNDVLAKTEKGEQSDPGQLKVWLDGHAPASKELFKDVPDSAVKPVSAE